MSVARARRDKAASIRQRLLNLAKVSGEEFQLMLDRYALERLLYRLSVSDMRADFVLKGALLFAIWFDELHRPTRDADLLGFGPPDQSRLADIIRQLCEADVDDALAFDTGSLRIRPIRENASHSGLRVNFLGMLGNARCHVQIDVGFGDAVTTEPLVVDFPCLLDDSPAPRLRIYPREAVCAEKLEAVVQLGITNTRMKDFFDLHVLAREGAMDMAEVSRAIAATFERRRTPLPESLPVGLTAAFSGDEQRREVWDSFLKRNRIEAPTLAAVIDEIVAYFGPALDQARELRGKGPPE